MMQNTEKPAHMLQWSEYRKQIASAVGDLSRLSPDTIRGYQLLGSAAITTNRLDAKTRELIALAAAVTLRCDGCIAVHTNAAKRLGLAREEIAEALGVAIAVSAGASLVYSTRVLDALNELDEQGA